MGMTDTRFQEAMATLVAIRQRALETELDEMGAADLRGYVLGRTSVILKSYARCEAVCRTGPGHQSTFRCERLGKHPNDQHQSIEGGWLLEWDEDGEMVD